MKRYILVILLIAGMGVAVPVAGETPPEFQVDQEAPQFPEDRSVKDEMDDFLAESGYVEGANTRDGGGEFFIAIGTGTIQAARNNPAYMSSRINAFEKAMLAAKKQMVEFVGVEIQKDVMNDYTEGENPLERKQKDDEAMKSPDMFNKAKALLNTKLDNLLAEEGIDLSKPVPIEAIKKAVTSEVFEKFTRTVANTRIVGIQSMKVFEASTDGKKGQIGVIAVYSEKLQKMADAMFSGGTTNLPDGTPKQPIVDQLPTDKLILLSTFGVQQKTDENGRLVLVAFGQGVPKSDSPRSLDAAYDKAKMEALGALRSFAGEVAAVESDMYEFESIQEFEDGMEQYESESYYKEKIKTNADALKISGIAKIKSWEAVHPLTNKKVAGVIVVWSPSSVAQASKMGKKMATQPQKSPPASAQPKKDVYKSGSNQGGSYRGASAVADKDSF